MQHFLRTAALVLAVFAASTGTALAAGGGADHGHEHAKSADAAHGDADHGHGDAAHGHGDGHHAPTLDPIGLGRHALNLAILLFILGYFLKTPVADFLKFRRSEVKQQLDTSWGAKTAAEARYKELEARLEAFDSELQTMIEGVQADAELERKRILAQAERSSAQVEAAARRTVEEELRRARAALRADTVDLSLQLAGTILTGKVETADQERLSSS